MRRYIEFLRRRRRDLEENLGRYLRELKELAERYGGRAYLFGSLLLGEAIAASDVDVLLEIPDGVDRLAVLREARHRVPNTLVEIHVLNASEAEVFKRLVKKVKQL